MSHVLVDSMDIRWSFHSVKNSKIRRHYRNFIRQYAVQTVIACAIDKMNHAYHSNNPKRQTSHYVFGILFASQYFRQCILKFCPPIHSEKDKIYIDLSSIPSADTAFVKNTMQHFVSPEYFVFSDDTPDPRAYPYQMHIEQFTITFPQNKSLIPPVNGPAKKKTHFTKLRQKLHDIFSINKPIHIPVKRLFLMPPNDVLAEPWLLNDLSQEKKANTIVLLGGAEQSLPQCHIINRHRWANDTQTRFHIGIAENDFDFNNAERYKFLIGTEGFVYGRCHGITIAPDENPDMTKRNQTEKLQIQLDQKDIVILYGYHAIATKICASKYFLEQLHLTKHFTMSDCERYLIQKGIHIPQITYQYTCNGSNEWEGIKHYWDDHNPLDRPELNPEDELRPIETEISAIILCDETEIKQI